MGLRFRKSVKIAPGVKMNLGNKGVSFTAGFKGAHVTKNLNGKTTTSVNIPGTGVSYTNTLPSSSSTNQVSSGILPTKRTNAKKHKKRGCLIPCIIAVLALIIIGGFIDNDVTKISISSRVSTLDINQTEKISVEITPSSSDAKLTYKSSDKNLVNFNNKLIKTGSTQGTAEIWVESENGVKSNKLIIDVEDKKAAKAEQERIAQEQAVQAEQERVAQEQAAKAEQERIAQEQAAKAEQERVAQEQAAKAEQERVAQEQAAKASAAQPQERMVWIPVSGSKYHSNQNCSNMNSPSQVPLSQAEANGFTACKKCY